MKHRGKRTVGGRSTTRRAVDGPRLPSGSPDLLHIIRSGLVPAILVRILLTLLLNPLLPFDVSINGAELFAGQQAITNALNLAGFLCIPYEIKLDHICMDLNSDSALLKNSFGLLGLLCLLSSMDHVGHD